MKIAASIIIIIIICAALGCSCERRCLWYSVLQSCMLFAFFILIPHADYVFDPIDNPSGFRVFFIIICSIMGVALLGVIFLRTWGATIFFAGWLLAAASLFFYQINPPVAEATLVSQVSETEFVIEDGDRFCSAKDKSQKSQHFTTIVKNPSACATSTDTCIHCGRSVGVHFTGAYLRYCKTGEDLLETYGDF